MQRYRVKGVESTATVAPATPVAAARPSAPAGERRRNSRPWTPSERAEAASHAKVANGPADAGDAVWSEF
jgi:hypothetical protein